jgi:sugar lactone lactonase YvrE
MMKNVITVPDGPEDMLLDTLSSAQPRLIVSCTKRRGDKAQGKICWVDLGTQQAHEFTMPPEREGELFQPHGIDLAMVNGEVLLYVISHTVAGKGIREEIRIYKVEGNALTLKESIADETFIISPNDIAVLPDGNFYFTNDTTKSESWQKVEMLLHLSSANLTYYDISSKSFRIEKRKIGFANGVEYDASTNVLLMTAIFHKELMIFDVQGNTLANERTVKVDKGLDNISLCGNGEAIIPAHTNLFRFYRHSKSAENRSPAIVYRVNYIGGTPHVSRVYETDGSDISTASTALEHNGRLYISQIFENFILVKKLANGAAVSE